jgi:hypothetical protein
MFLGGDFAACAEIMRGLNRIILKTGGQRKYLKKMGKLL